MSLPQNLLALCETMLPGENQRGRPDAATLKRCISTAYYAIFLACLYMPLPACWLVIVQAEKNLEDT